MNLSIVNCIRIVACLFSSCRFCRCAPFFLCGLFLALVLCRRCFLFVLIYWEICRSALQCHIGRQLKCVFDLINTYTFWYNWRISRNNSIRRFCFMCSFFFVVACSIVIVNILFWFCGNFKKYFITNKTYLLHCTISCEYEKNLFFVIST